MPRSVLLVNNGVGDPGTAWGRGLSWYQANTGVPTGTVLTDVAGFTASTNGATYQNLNITGAVTVNADNVTLRNCRITGSPALGTRGVMSYGTGTRYENCTFVGWDDAVGGSFWTAYRCEFTQGGSDGGKTGDDSHVIDCFLHDQSPRTSGAQAHVDGFQLADVVGPVSILRSWIDLPLKSEFPEPAMNSCTFVKPDGPGWGSDGPVLIDGNYMSTDGYCGQYRSNGGYVIHNVTVTNNVMDDSRGYGPWYIDAGVPAMMWSGNTTPAGAIIPHPSI